MQDIVIDLLETGSQESKSSEASDEPIVQPPEEKALKPEPKPEPKLVKKQIRIDIQILRAISIILVLLYHLGVPNVGGGFIGVDIFFVISGYLVTGSFIKEIVKRHENPPPPPNNIVLENIYISFLLRRIKRLIIPSSICLLLVLLGVYLSPLEIPQGRESVRYAAINYINFYLWKTSGAYGSDNTKTNVVLHFWSLALEWQFYYVFPLVLIGIWSVISYFDLSVNILKNSIRFLLVSVSALTFGLCFAGNSEARFYLLHTRAWEFLVGAMVNMEENSFLEFIQPTLEYPYSDLVIKIIVCILFCALSVAGYFIPFQQGMWPGWWTLYPVGLTCVVIILKREFGKNIVTSPFVYIGDWSYSIYLYHWPIIVFANVYVIATNSITESLFVWGACLFLIFCSAVASYYLVEKLPNKYPIPDVIWIGMFAFLTILIVSLTFIPLLHTASPTEYNITFSLQTNITEQERRNLLQTTWNMKQGPNVWLSKDDQALAFSNIKRNIELLTPRNWSKCIVIIGDSHSQQFHTLWNNTADLHNASFYRLTRACTGGTEMCFLDVIVNSLPIPKELDGCKNLLVFLAIFHYNYQDENLKSWQTSFKKVATEYAKRGTVFVYKDFQWSNGDPYPADCILESSDVTTCKKDINVVTGVTPKYEKVINDLSMNENVGVVDILPYITTNNGYVFAYNYDYPLLFDPSHLSENFMNAFSPTFQKIINHTIPFQKFVTG